MFFSIIIPLYNRPLEIQELLSSLVKQNYRNFEVIIIDDGSKIPAKDIVESFKDNLDVQYFYKENAGQGFARNYGFERAKGDYFIVFDSDIIVPENYLNEVICGINGNLWDAFGGPDAAHSSFTTIQKAISYSMTSPFTTGGIRGNKKHVGQFHPRSFNLGISRAVWEKTGGFKLSRRSEDIEFSIRIIEEGFKVGLIPGAFVYHKRRANFSQFFKQILNFGKGRIEIWRLYPSELKWVHALPAFFTVALLVLILLNLVNCIFSGDIHVVKWLALIGNIFISLYVTMLFIHAVNVTRSIKIAILAIFAAFTQLTAYGLGFISRFINLIFLRKIS